VRDLRQIAQCPPNRFIRTSSYKSEAEEVEDERTYNNSEVEAVPDGEASDGSTNSEAELDARERKRKRPLFSNKQRYEICVCSKEEFETTVYDMKSLYSFMSCNLPGSELPNPIGFY